ncbi:DUF2523 domain-containing protein [Acidithiobacillus ferrooxidans F221]|uniref:DUF2523 family protein n=1 Tax=Acidithiobacillus ferrooxidans TaxID=920 RepID=UPI001C075992|nr:DUF2523 family protein [Acidithiobacillus ferrooxidans]MBU2808029.1 DUF2523 domain-containing protein [Acidithiobacillus ferrooxidans F221]
MGAIISAFAEWLAPFVMSALAWLVSSIGPAVLASLTVGVGVYTGFSVIQSDLSSVIFAYSSLPSDMLAIAQLLGATFVLKLFVSAFSVRVSIMAARTFFFNAK